MRLSVYAFSEYGHDAKLYNGIRDLELRNAVLHDALKSLAEIVAENNEDMQEPHYVDLAATLNILAEGESSDGE